MADSIRSEKAEQNDILLDMSRWPNTMIWRNNTGMAWQGERVSLRVGAQITVEPGMVVLRKGRPVKFGLEGSADIIGATNGVPLAAEVKKKKSGRQSQQQGKFETAWRKAGGLYMIVHDSDEAWEKVMEYVFS